MAMEAEPLLGEGEVGIADPVWGAPATTQTPGPRDMKGFSVQVIREGEVAKLLLSGELDIATAPQLEDHLRAIEIDGVRTILIDLASLTFMDSSGLHTFLGASRRAGEHGRRLTFANCPGGVRRVFELTRTAGLLDGVPFAEI